MDIDDDLRFPLFFLFFPLSMGHGFSLFSSSLLSTILVCRGHGGRFLRFSATRRRVWVDAGCRQYWSTNSGSRWELGQIGWTLAILGNEMLTQGRLPAFVTRFHSPQMASCTRLPQRIGAMTLTALWNGWNGIRGNLVEGGVIQLGVCNAVWRGQVCHFFRFAHV